MTKERFSMVREMAAAAAWGVRLRIFLVAMVLASVLLLVFSFSAAADQMYLASGITKPQYPVIELRSR